MDVYSTSRAQQLHVKLLMLGFIQNTPAKHSHMQKPILRVTQPIQTITKLYKTIRTNF